MFYRIAQLILWPIFRLIFRFKVIGYENIPLTGPVLIASNHLSNLDPPLLGVAVRGRALNCMAKAELFKFTPFAWLLRALNVFPIKRGSPDRKAIRRAINLLKEGQGFFLFPEGTRSSNGKLGQGQPGAGMIISQAQKSCALVIIPARIRGSELAMPRGAFFIRPKHVEVKFGPPVTLDKIDGQGQSKEVYQKIVDTVMEQINRL
ncbi:MAG: lysophospholipid acyltransferase family protein [bacterium]|nr:lysophospholipid acyltransferase family protein [bacterium]